MRRVMPQLSSSQWKLLKQDERLSDSTGKSRNEEAWEIPRPFAG